MANPFKKRNIFLMVFLTIVTAGWYLPYYYFKLMKTTDTLSTSTKIHRWLIYFYPILLFVNVIINYISIKTPSYKILGDYIGWIGLIISIIIAFKFKDILSEYFNPKTNPEFSVLATFFLTIFYLQYKIENYKE